MEKYGKLCTVFLTVLFIAGSASAYDGFDVSIDPVNTVVDPAEEGTAVFNISVTNRMEERENFFVGYSTGTATSPSWYFMKGSNLGLEPNSTGSSVLYITPDRGAIAGNKGPEVYVYPTGDADNRFSKLITFTVSRDSSMIVTDFVAPESSYHPSESLESSMTVKNVVQREFPANRFEVRFSIADKTFTRSIPDLDSGEMASVDVSIPLTGFDARGYDFTADLVDTETGGVLDSKQARVSVDEDRSVARDSDMEESFLRVGYTYSLRNDGNVMVDENITERVSWLEHYFISFDRRPDTTFDDGGQKVLVWKFEDISPGSSVSVSYSKNYWSGVVVVMIVLLVSYLVYTQLKSVSVVKFVNRKSEGYSVNVRVRNRTGRKVSKVKVEDFVPGIATLVHNFDSRSPDKIQKTDEGTRVVWEVDGMEPGEERIFMYRIKPRIQVEGSINLPEAVVEYRVKNKTISDSSHSVSTDFK